jgi:membrane protein implicated in regulation of membrane protease activity
VGGLLTIVAGVEMFFSGQLDVGKIHVQVGIEGLQATILPLILVLLGILAMAMPVHRIFYGVIALAVAVYSLIGDNLGGFFIGMLLASVGGILIVAWMPRSATRTGEPVDGTPDRADRNADESARVARPLVQRRS